MDWFDDEEDEDEEMSSFKDGPYALYPSCSYQTISSFFFDMDFMIYHNLECLFESFDLTLNSLSNAILNMDLENLSFDKSVSKMILKYRHNIFSDIFKQCLNINTTLNTDVSLKEYGSNKTPDLLIEKEDEILLIEFTVSSTRERVEFNKGGGLHPLKYSEEALVISELTGKKCEVIIVYLTLKEPNIDEMKPICDRLDINFNNFKECCNRFLKIWSKYSMIIMPVVSLSFIQEYVPTPNMERSYENNSVHLGENTISFIEVGLTQSEYVSIRQSIVNWHKGLAKAAIFRGVKTYSLTIELNSGSVGIEVVSKNSSKLGISKELLFKFIETMDIASIICNSTIFRRDKIVPITSLSGDITYVIPKDFQKIVKNDYVPDKIGILRYNNNFPVYEYLISRGLDSSSKSETFKLYKLNLQIGSEKFDKYPNTPIIIGIPKKYLFKNDYMDNLLDKIDPEKLSKSDTNKTLLSSNVLTKETIIECSQLLIKSMNKVNANIKIREKRSFIVPLPTGQLQYGSINDIDYGIGASLGSSNEFTKEAFRIASQGKFVQVDTDERLLELNENISKGEGKLHISIKERFSDSQKIPKRHDLVNVLQADDPLMVQIENLKKLQIQRKKILVTLPKLNRTTKTIRLQSKKNSRMGFAFASEMAHYQRKEGIAGVGLNINHLFDNIDKEINSLFKWMICKPSESCKTKIYDKEQGPGPQFLTDHKKLMLSGFEEISNDFLESNLAKVLEFASRLAHTLFKLSTLPLNGDHITFDNLGYKNVWLLVRGGKKMYKTSTTKLYKLIHPADSQFDRISGLNDDHYKFMYKGTRMVCTPWMQMNASILKDTHSIYHRIFMDIAISLKRCSKEFSEISKADLLTCLLAFHQKRQTEVALHNMRYLIVNPTGEFSNLSGIIPSFASVNYSYFDAWVKKSIENNFVSFSNSMIAFKNLKTKRIIDALKTVEVRNIITLERISEPYELVSMIYMTYTMSKGQYNRAVEQSANWKGVCQDVLEYKDLHSDVIGLNDKSLRFELSENKIEAYQDDYNYDPAFCQYIGYRLKNRLLKKVGKHRIWEFWSQSINKSVTNIANKNGLRGFEQKNFFNKKGYEILTDFFVKRILEGDISKNMSDLDVFSEREKIRELRAKSKSVGDACIQFELTEAIFHIVEKSQRAGNREIYVMDIFTKFYQNPMEDFFGKICKEVESEVISIPSDVRPSMMHTLYYENESKWADHIYNLVLDCRRWAPHSNFQKYFHFLHGMSEILPDSFLKHFSFFFDKMIKKKVITRDYVVNSFKNNESYKPIMDIMTECDGKTKGGWSITMEFSFMMGMFNYLSSLMHAANQMFIADFSRLHLERKFGICSHLVCLAHSDDSTAKFYFKSTFTSRLPSISSNKDEITEQSVLKEFLTVYDWLLKGANHMISVKKSVVSKIYQEFLSILYLFGENVSVLKKFTASISFEATDQGYSNDVSYAVSKCLEMLQNGGTLEEVYFSMKIAETYIRSFYKLPKADPNIPFEFMGLLDCHPIEAWLMGTKAEMYKHIVYNRENTNRCLAALTKDVFIADRDIFDFSLKWNMGSKLNPILRERIMGTVSKVDKELMGSWTIKNGKFNNIYPYYLWYCAKICDPKFYSSMVSDSIERRMARIYGAFNSRHIKTDYGSYRAFEVYELIRASLKIESPDKIGKFLRVMEPVMREMDYFWEASEQLNGIKLNMASSNLTLKPTRLNHRPPIIGNNLTINSSKIVTHFKEPSYYWLYADENDPSSKARVISDYFKMVELDPFVMSPDDLRYVIEKICGLQTKAKRILAYSSSDNRNLMSMESIFELISTGSCYGKRILIQPRVLSGLDSEYFNTKAGIPISVISFSKLFWLNEKISSLNTKFEILLPKFYTEMSSLKNSIDIGWRELVSSTVDNCRLGDLMYWSTWILSQKRLTGGIWAGKGLQFHRTIEFVCNVHLEGRLITRFEMSFENHGSFSRATQWYLEAIMNNDVGLKENMVSSDSFQIGKNYLCYNEDSGVWGINDRSSRCLVLEIDEDCYPPDWFNTDLEVIRRNGKLCVPCNNSFVQIKSVLDRPFQSIKVLREYIDVDSIKEKRADPELRRVLLELQRMFFDVPIIDPIDFFQRILSSRLYNMLHDSEDSLHIVLRAAMRYKELNKSFLFPDEEMLSNFINSGNVHQMPESLLQSLKLMPKLDVDDNFKKMAFEEFYQAVVEGETRNQGVLNNLHAAFLDKTQNAIARIMSINIDMYYIVSLSFNRDYQHIEWLCDLLDIISLFKEVSPQSRHEQMFMTKNVFHKCVGFILFCSDYSERSSYTKLLIDILDELLDLGLLGFFQIERKGSFISTDFNSMGRERFVQMFKNLLCNTVTVKGSSFLIKNKNKPIHSTEDLYQKIYGKSDIKFWKTRMRFDGLDMVIEMKNSKNRLIRPSSIKMVVKLCSDEEYRRTCSDDPDDIDEALDEFFCGDEPNLTEKIRDGLYCCYSTKITARHLLMIGGTAENIMIKTHNISGCVRSLGFFNKISIFQPNITTQLENVEERILIISESKRVSLNGYTRVRKNELHNYFRPKDGTEIKYNYDNTNIGREVFDVSNFAQFDKLTAYSRKLYNVSIDPKIKTKMKFLEGIVEIQPTEKQMKLRTEIENYIANIIVNPDGQVIDNIKKFVGEFDSNSLKTKLSETINSFEVIPQPTAIDISSDVDLIQDEKILSESNVFSQHILNKLIRGDVRLKKSQKVGIKAMMVNLIATYKGTAYIDNVLALKVIIDSFMADSKEVRSNSDDQVFDDIMEFLDSLTKEDYVSSPRPRAENENFILDISFLDKR